MLQKPQKQVCQGQTVKYPIAQQEPLDWLRKENAAWEVLNIDSFVVDKDKKVSAIFQKLEYTVPNYQFSLPDLFKIYPPIWVKSLLEIAQQLGCPYRLFVWKKDFIGENVSQILEEKRIEEISLGLENEQVIQTNSRFISLKELENLILTYRKRSFSNPKPVQTGTSCVSCYLSNYTPNPWAGDIDGLLYNPQTKKIGVILEFKTHNIDSSTEKEWIGKYGQADFRRFEVLYNLQKCLFEKTGYEPKIAYIAWGTQDFANHQNLKIDRIKNNQILKTIVIPRPVFGEFSEELFTKVVWEL